MADHRAEQIMDAFVSAVTGLTTTGTNVERDRWYAWDDDVTASLSVYQGDDNPVNISDRNYYQDDFILDVHVDIHAKLTSDTPISQTLNLIRKEIIIAVQADQHLGLSGFVINTEEQTAHRPVIQAGEKPTALQQFDFTVKYRRSRADPSA